MPEPLLSVRHLTTTFTTDRGRFNAVDDVSFDVPLGKTVALVGESGCGKSVTALSIMRLLPSPPAEIASGEIWLGPQDLLTLKERELRRLRGSRVAMIFQEPMTSLCPVYSVGRQIVEAIRIHRPMGRRSARARAVELLTLVGIPSPRGRFDAFPHQLSGGMRQRVVIAMALACEPELLIADEPTTSLDVTIQAQILTLLRDLQRELGMGILFITHDLGIVAEFADEAVIMYAGRVVERTSVVELFDSPMHPYTRGLLRCLPGSAADEGRRLPAIEGMVPDLLSLPDGCRFQERCALCASRPVGFERCTREEPEWRQLGAGGSRGTRCFYPDASA